MISFLFCVSRVGSAVSDVSIELAIFMLMAGDGAILVRRDTVLRLKEL